MSGKEWAKILVEVTMNKILICDDDKDIAESIKIYLNKKNYELFIAHNGMDALKIMQQEKIDLVLLDIMMPQMDGISVLAKIREQDNVPVILLMARSEESDIVLGLNMGADDYITKPFNPLELTARVNSQLRRYTELGSDLKTSDSYRIGGIELSDTTKEVFVGGRQVSLTPKEFDILKFLMANPGQVFAPSYIYREVWKECPLDGSDNIVAVHIRHIREKIEIDPNNPSYIRVVFGQGYKIEKGNKR